MSKLILVSNRLPVRFNADGTPERTHGGLASALDAVETDAELHWVGWPGMPAEEIEDQGKLTNQLVEKKIHPVFLTAEEVTGFYEQYSNATLWPLLHGMTQRAQFNEGWFDLYKQANERFAEAIQEIAGPGDIVWVQDYQLFLLPQLLRGTGKNLQIGFFLHTPFPSSDTFRVLAERGEILKGMLGADLIGFHTFNYLRHFRSALLRVLGMETEHDSVFYEGGRRQFGVFPIGHNQKGFEAAMDTPEFLQAQAEAVLNMQGRKLVLNVERLDYTKGVPQKLAAIRHFLANNPEERGKIIFVIIAVPSRETVEEYVELTESVQQEVGAINGEYGDLNYSPVNFLHRGFPPVELAAFYSVADVCLVTPLIDGMNLVAKEYVCCKKREKQSTPGVLVLSEFAGAAAEMSQALLVNPYAKEDVSKAISQALNMPEEEKWERLGAMQQHLLHNDAGAWARRFLQFFETHSSREPGASLISVQKSLVESVKAGKKVSLFLDYDGTLRNFTLKPEDAVPDRKLVPLLQTLGQRCDITICSGRPADFLEEHFGGLGFTLVAEHGYRWSRPDSTEWELFNPLIDTAWKDSVRPQLEQITLLTPGSHIEEKPSALVWHYRGADLEFGNWQAKRLLAELTDISASLPVAVHHGKKIVEVASLQVNKGRAVEALLTDLGTQVGLAAGDDQTDETMFALHPEIDAFHTIHIGNTNTRADHIARFSGFRAFLENVADSLQQL